MGKVTPRHRIAAAIHAVVPRKVNPDHALRAAEVLEAQELSSMMIRATYRTDERTHRMVSEALNDTLHA